MKYVRLFSDLEGQSHFEEVEMPLSAVDYAPPAPPFDLSTPIPTARCLFCTVPAGWHGNWHPTPRRQFFLPLSGELEVEVSDGDVRRFGPGSVVLLEDVTGQGHVTRVVVGAPVLAAFIQLPD